MTRLLFVDACVRRGTSRTEWLAQAYLAMRRSREEITVETLVLEEAELPALDEAGLALREACLARRDYSHPVFRLARQFAAAEEVLIAAPYWDLSFPAVLKLYCEQICINGITFRYTEEGCPMGLTAIRRGTYITTAGGFIGDCDYGYQYVNGLMERLFGIPALQRFAAEGLDIRGNEPALILQKALASMRE